MTTRGIAARFYQGICHRYSAGYQVFLTSYLHHLEYMAHRLGGMHDNIAGLYDDQVFRSETSPTIDAPIDLETLFPLRTTIPAGRADDTIRIADIYEVTLRD